jgi:hypothetical protein
VTGVGAAASVYGAVFTDVKADGRSLVVKSVTSFTTTRSGNMLTVAYVDQDVGLQNKNAKVMQSSWVVQVDTAGTAENPADDRINVSGTYQRVDGTVLQAALTNVVVAGTCGLNPIAGTALIEHVGSGNSSAEVTSLSFHSACDGRADVVAAVSANIGSLLNGNKTVALDFRD